MMLFIMTFLLFGIYAGIKQLIQSQKNPKFPQKVRVTGTIDMEFIDEEDTSDDSHDCIDTNSGKIGFAAARSESGVTFRPKAVTF